jgi:hypothetical protein
MPAHDRARGDQAMATQCPGQPLDERGEDRPVRPVQVRSRIGAAQHRDLVAQNKELDALGGGRANRQQDQPEHLREDQIQQRSDTSGSCPPADDRWSATQPEFWNPTGDRDAQDLWVHPRSIASMTAPRPSCAVTFRSGGGAVASGDSGVRRAQRVRDRRTGRRSAGAHARVATTCLTSFMYRAAAASASSGVLPCSRALR